MSTLPDAKVKAGSTSKSDASSGSKSVLQKQSNGSKPSDLTLIHQEPAEKKKRSRLSRIFRSSVTKGGAESTDEPQNSAQRRRQQVYQAQKRHRSRNADYIKNLETEVARLQHLDAMMSSEKNALAHQNIAIRELLMKKSIDAQFDLMHIDSSASPYEDVSQLGAATLDARFDPEVNTQRWFLDLPGLSWSSSDNSQRTSTPKPTERGTPVPGDSWAALDFILALEWPCRKHIYHPTIYPDPDVSEACKLGKFHGHGLTATQAVFQSAQPPQHKQYAGWLGDNTAAGQDAHTSDNWVLPHSEIDKLVQLSEMLEIDDEFITPAQAYAAVRATVPNEKYLRPALQALKAPLGQIAECQGFGAGVDAGKFWQLFDSALQELQATRPELE